MISGIDHKVDQTASIFLNWYPFSLSQILDKFQKSDLYWSELGIDHLGETNHGHNF